jgi:alpha-amylase
MSAHVNLAMVFHQHQPVGNYGFVFEELFRLSYEPLVASLERHPGVRAALHYSGPLLDWLKRQQPEYVGRIRDLVGRGQVEVMGGGYYEPILPALSTADRIGQMVKLRDEIERLFGQPPAGMWLPERVWEPDLPQSIAAAGYRWTIVDDVHFEASGTAAQDLRGWYVTEDQGSRLGVFASSTRFRYLVPWGTVGACIDFLRAHGNRFPGSLLSVGDDGEKFGGWPTTYRHCWEEGWVDAFFGRLEQESPWISTVLPTEWQGRHAADGLVYLPATSYMEMGEWSLPPDAHHALADAKAALREREDLQRLLRGGHWRNFLVRYPEVNALHKRLQILSVEAHRRGQGAALDEVWQAQCNCPWWHGVFGGVYLEHIRHANFAHVAKADALLFPGARPVEVLDIDSDGRDEMVLRSQDHLVAVVPHRGGEILHWELRRPGWHLTHVMARRPEAYHTGLRAVADESTRNIHDTVRLKDPRAAELIGQYDLGMRVANQVSCIAGPVPSPEEYAALRLVDVPVLAPSVHGAALTMHGEGQQIAVELEGHDLVVAAAGPAGHALLSEWNLSLPERAGGAPPEFDASPGALTIVTGMFTLRAAHNADGVRWDQVLTVSNTEDGVTVQPQGWAVVFAAAPGEGRRGLNIRWSVA